MLLTEGSQKDDLRTRPSGAESLLSGKEGAMSVTTRDFDSPDETRTFENGRTDLVKVGDFTLGRYTFQPGWRWSENVKPIAKTESCQVHHVGSIVSGRLRVVSDDGAETEVVAGHAYEIQPGHDAWVVGDEPVVFVEFQGAERYAKPTD